MSRVRIATQRYARSILSCLVLLSAASVLAQPAAQAPRSRQTLKVLFIGNSYTFFNNLGDIVSGIAAAESDGPLITPTLAVSGGKTLKWHLENGPALKSLQAGEWDYVVLQEQSLLGGKIADGKTVVGDPSEFYGSVRELVRRIRAVGATPLLYMTWARREAAVDSERVQKQLADAYLAIGRELGVEVAPVGLAWAEARRRLRTLDLHSWDASHPAAAGSYLTACVIYSTITGRSPEGAPSVIQGHPVVGSEEPVVDLTLRVPLVDLPDATAAELQRSAWYVVSSNHD